MKSKSARAICSFVADRKGTVAIMFGMFAVPLFGLIGTAIDVSQAMTKKVQLQAAVDAAVVAGARLPATANQNRYDATEHMLLQRLADAGLSSATNNIQASNAEVRVTATYSHPTLILPIMGVTSLEVKAVSAGRSQIENGGVACVLALNPTTGDGLHLQGINKATSHNCWTWINSSAASSINAVGASVATAQGFCTVGGVTGSEHFHPSPYTGCEAMADPFAEKFATTYPDGACNVTNLELKKGTHTLQPGIYCGGIRVRVQAKVTLAPGTYLIKDGEFNVDAQASVTGNGVTLIFRGANTRLEVRSGADFVVKAPNSGTYAGFVLVDRKLSASSSVRETVVQGGGRIKIEGILYAPQWRMNISGNGDINQESQYFAMIADHFYMEGNGKLHIKSDYAEANLPDLMPKIKTGPMLLE
jgi:hypothetical protein